MKLEQRLKNLKRPLVLDGAMGSLLQAKGLPIDKYLWASFLNITNPDKVLALHKAYVEAGAEIITTNTFRTNPAAVELSGYNIDVKAFVSKSVQLAKEAVAEKEVLIAGSNSPAEDCYQREVTLPQHKIVYNHQKHIELLWEAEVDFILNETHGHLFEIETVSRFCSQNKIPFVTSLFFDEDLNLLSGEPLTAGIETVLSYEPLAVSFNCVLPKRFKKFAQNFEPNFQWGFYFNCGGENYASGKMETAITPERYIEVIKEVVNKKTVIIGSCCGSTPEHTKFIRKFVDSLDENFNYSFNF